MERGEWADLSQFTQMHVPKHFENALDQALTQLRYWFLRLDTVMTPY